MNRFKGKKAPKPKIAGNYGTHSNVWQVGAIVRLALSLPLPLS